ncbi:MAG TPA: hypothetical protein VIX86_04635 [Streptosporangiaceae bacterium]
MSILSDAQIIALWLKAGGPVSAAPMALARALAESSGEAGVTSSNPNGGTNVGLWQLDTEGVGSGYTVAQLQDPATNARLTVKGSNGGRNWSAWPDNWPAYIGQAHKAVTDFETKAAHHPGGRPGYVDDVLRGLGGIFTGNLGQAFGAAGSAAGSAAGALGQIVLPAQVTGFLSAAEDVIHGALWLLNPSNQLRILAGVAGVILAGLGVYVFTRAAG